MVENRPGAATIIGATAVSQAEPSGYMIGTADSGTLAFNPSLYAKLSYDPSKFTYIGGIAKFPLLLAVNVNSPYKSVADVIAAAKKEPGKLTAASAGAGSPHHLALELFKQRTGAELLHVPYKGAAPAIQDLLGGQVDVMFIDLAAGLPNVKAGKLRVLAAATPERVAVLPDAPTMAEQGVANFTAYAGRVWSRRPACRRTWSRSCRPTGRHAQDPGRVAEDDGHGRDPHAAVGAGIQGLCRPERAAWADVIKKAGIKLE